MKSSVTKDFRKKFDLLPRSIQEQTVKAYKLWRLNPYYSSLQFKLISQRQPIYSVRIGIGYKALGLLDQQHIYWFWIGPHAEYDKLLKQM